MVVHVVPSLFPRFARTPLHLKRLVAARAKSGTAVIYKLSKIAQQCSGVRVPVAPVLDIGYSRMVIKRQTKQG